MLQFLIQHYCTLLIAHPISPISFCNEICILSSASSSTTNLRLLQPPGCKLFCYYSTVHCYYSMVAQSTCFMKHFRHAIIILISTGWHVLLHVLCDRNYYTAPGKILLSFQISTCALEERKHNSKLHSESLVQMVTYSGECHVQERRVGRKWVIK